MNIFNNINSHFHHKRPSNYSSIYYSFGGICRVVRSIQKTQIWQALELYIQKGDCKTLVRTLAGRGRTRHLPARLNTKTGKLSNSQHVAKEGNHGYLLPFKGWADAVYLQNGTKTGVYRHSMERR